MLNQFLTHYKLKTLRNEFNSELYISRLFDVEVAEQLETVDGLAKKLSEEQIDTYRMWRPALSLMGWHTLMYLQGAQVHEKLRCYYQDNRIQHRLPTALIAACEDPLTRPEPLFERRRYFTVTKGVQALYRHGTDTGIRRVSGLNG